MRILTAVNLKRRSREADFLASLLSVLLMAAVLPAAAQTDNGSAGPAPTREEGTAQTAETEKAQNEEAAPADQAEPAEPQDEKSSKAYPVTNGTVTYRRTEESEKKKTADGEIEIHRVRMPAYGGDQRVLLERETRTKKLPDGTIEKEHVLKNPDGSNRMVPIEIIREKIKTDGDSTIIEREVLKQDYAGRWQPTRKERVTQTGPEEGRQSLKEVRELNLAGDWKIVDREVTTETSSGGEKQSRSVRQVPDASGRLADYEVRQQRTARDGDKETTDVSVQRRDMQDAVHPKLILVERTRTEQTKSEDGRVTTKSTTESDLVAGGASRNITPGAPKVVEERTEVEVPGPDGASRRTVTVKERGAVDREMRPSSQIVQETDSKGNVRQIFIPAR
jgi:hypothetical protein